MATKKGNKSSYQNRIEKKLAELSIALDPQTIVNFRLRAKNGQTIDQTVLGNAEWNVTRLHRGHRQCELCGHNPILNIFTIKSKRNNKTLEIGSECAKNYMDADLVAGLCKVYNLEYKKIVNPIQFEKELNVLEWAKENYAALTGARGVRTEINRHRNGAFPVNLIHKINSGKVIGKEEKRSIDFWTELHKAGIPKVQAVGGIGQFLFSVGKRVQTEIREKEYQSRMVQYGLRNLGAFLVNLEVFNERLEKQNAADAAHAVASAFYSFGVQLRERKPVENKVPENDVVAELFKNVYDNKPNYGQKKFVASLYSFYKRFGKLSEKQFAALEKISNQLVA